MAAEGGDYKILEKVGEGAFGTVFRALDRATGAEVALKRIRIRDVRALPVNAVRELNALRRVDHPHVISLIGMHTHGANMVLVMPFVPHSLAAILSKRDAPLAERDAAAIGTQLLQGVAAIHAEGLLHRDLKPANCLLSASGTLLVADFGQARLQSTDANASLSHAVATRWYRAPELLYGARRYGIGVDAWACGCVLAQLLTLSPLLPGESDIDQLFRVVHFLGSPKEDVWPGVSLLPDYHKIELPPDVPPTPLRQLMPLASDAALASVEPFLRYDAGRRCTPRDALASPWFLHASRPPPTPADLLPKRCLPTAKAGKGSAARTARKTSEDLLADAFPAPMCRRAAAPPEGSAAVRAVGAGLGLIRQAPP